MKKWLVTIAALWLAGCSSGEINKNYYQLPVVQSGTQSTASQGNRLLWVEQVAVPDYLAGNGVVYQTSDVKYVIANNNLWASPLDQQLRNTLVANLSTHSIRSFFYFVSFKFRILTNQDSNFFFVVYH